MRLTDILAAGSGGDDIRDIWNSTEADPFAPGAVEAPPREPLAMLPDAAAVPSTSTDGTGAGAENVPF